MTDSKWLKKLIDMRKSYPNPPSSTELVASADIDRLIKLTKKPTFNEIKKKCDHANYSIEVGQYGDNMVMCRDCKEYIEL